jgi:tetratricopeptide (TPR) repeat protein
VKVLRVFVSSPGDVGRERELAGQVLNRLQGEYIRRVKLEPYLWEYEPMRATTDYQGNIPKPSDFDIVICILWSRLGSRLNEKYRHADGSPYASGTEYELEEAAESFTKRGTPAIYVYRNQQQPMIPIEPEDVREEKVRQYKALQNFVERWFLNPDGTFRIASNTYNGLADFQDKLESDLHKIIEEKALPLPESPGARVRFGTYTKGSPFRRLRAFEFEDAEVFFGRTKAIDDVLNAMQAQAAADCAFTLIFGGSGSGKSSLARAGIMPMLVRPGVVEGIGLWRWATLRPSEGASDIFAGLAAALMSKTALPEMAASGTSAEDLTRALREAPGGVPLLIKTNLAQIARDVQTKEQLNAPPSARFLLLVDQLEELFTMADRFPLETRKRFVAAIGEMARSGTVWVLATLRSEFYSGCEEIPELVTLKSGQGQYQLLPPTKSELSQIIRLPAIAAGLEFEVEAETGTSLDDALLDAAGRNPGALPLIEFTLDELYNRRRDDRVLTHAAFRELRGIEGALETAAEDVFKALPPEVASLFDVIFRALVTVEKDSFVRRVAKMDALGQTAERQHFLHAFVEGRLLVTDRDEQNRSVVQVAHEALFTHWPRLQQMLQADREFLRRRARASAAFGLWEEQNRDSSYLWWSGKLLTEVKTLLARSEELDAREQEFARASVAAGESAKRKRLLAAVAALLVALAAGVSGYLWWNNYREAGQVRALRAQLANVLAATPPAPYAVSDLSRRILEKVPNDSETWALQAKALLDQNDYAGFDAALERWQHNVSPKPAKIDALRGDKEMKQDRPLEAIKAWSAYLRHPDLDIDSRRASWRKLASAHAKLGQWIEARDRLTEWIKAEDNLEARVQRARMNQQLRDWDAAQQDLERAREINPSDPQVKNFGPIMGENKKIEELNEQVEKSPRDPATWIARATELTRQQQFQAALEDIDHALNLDPDSVRLAIEKAHLLWQLQQSIPDDPGVLVSENWTRDKDKFPSAFEAAEASLETLGGLDARIAQQPENVEAYLERGDLLNHLGQFSLAIRDFTRALEIDSRSIQALQHRASAYRAAGQTQLAEADLRRVNELTATSTPQTP